MAQYKTIAELPDCIVLDKLDRNQAACEPAAVYQSEHALEREFIEDLVSQGYEYLPDLTTPAALMANVRTQLQQLNNTSFSDQEWERFVKEYLDRPGEGTIEKTRKIHDNYVYDFVFDDGHIKNIRLVDKDDISRNRLQVINQFEQTGSCLNRYDVTILVNGLPMVQVELKKRGVAIREAFYQIHRYSRESFNSDSSMFRYLQMFVISNGTDTRYFANTVKRDKNSFDFTMNWALSNNRPINDLRDFAATFFQKNTLLEVLMTYSVFDANDTLLIMRPYQIAATERVLRKIRCAHSSKTWSTPDGGGYIWHTTGSGKTLTSFKTARLAQKLDCVDRVFFVVDRKDLDYQTMKEYQRFSPGSVNGSESTAALKRHLQNEDDKIIVTTIQKLNNLMRSEKDLPVYRERVVFIFDEAHRSQFGEAQKNLRKKFKHYFQFGFTGTPIFAENANGSDTTESVFGKPLHSYVITDAIRDDKVLKFKVDYNDVRPRFSSLEKEQDEVALSAAENRKLFLHPERIREISQYILDNYRLKTHRNLRDDSGFNAMFAVSSVEAAKLYYQELNSLQKGTDNPLKIATIFSFVPNEEQNIAGEISEENFEPTAMDSTAKEFLSKAIDDYNAMFGTNFGIDGREFQNYYRDLAKRIRNREIDLVIVVGMFLTGFDAPRLNTLFVDKNLRYHGLMQAYSRTNRIYDKTKPFGNIVTFRDLQEATKTSIAMFADQEREKADKIISITLERSYTELMEGCVDASTGERKRGYSEVVSELGEKFPDPAAIDSENDKKEFVNLFGEYLRLENVLRNYDEFTQLKALRSINPDDKDAIEAFKNAHHLSDEKLSQMLDTVVLNERNAQDYMSAYNDIRDWFKNVRDGKEAEKSKTNWDDVVFEVDLIKSQEIDLDYILELLFEQNKKSDDKDSLIEMARRMIRASIGNRAKEDLIVEFINVADLHAMNDKTEIISEFYDFARKKLADEASAIIIEENLNPDAAERYMRISLRRRFASDNGTDLNAALPKMSPLNPLFREKKQKVYRRIVAFVEKYRCIGEDV